MTVTFTSHLSAAATPLKHAWEHTVGSSRALLALRADWQEQLQRCHDELGFRHVRFHGLLDDDMGTLISYQEKPLYSFFNVDRTRISRFAFGGANAARMMPGFPSYCAGSLLVIASSITFRRCPRIGHCVFLHAGPDGPPNQVRLRYGPPTSNCFLQTPPLAGDALASWILFPMDRARPLTISGWVCQLRWANKKPRQGAWA